MGAVPRLVSRVRHLSTRWYRSGGNVAVGGVKEDFTLSHRFHLDSRWTPGGFPESMWSLDYFFFGVG
jgi:hypothetical protein